MPRSVPRPTAHPPNRVHPSSGRVSKPRVRRSRGETPPSNRTRTVGDRTGPERWTIHSMETSPWVGDTRSTRGRGSIVPRQRPREPERVGGCRKERSIGTCPCECKTCGKSQSDVEVIHRTTWCKLPSPGVHDRMPRLNKHNDPVCARGNSMAI
eukprot:scaffold60_cov325-Pavlova_lutheri.AAC.17